VRGRNLLWRGGNFFSFSEKGKGLLKVKSKKEGCKNEGMPSSPGERTMGTIRERRRGAFFLHKRNGGQRIVRRGGDRRGKVHLAARWDMFLRGKKEGNYEEILCDEKRKIGRHQKRD